MAVHRRVSALALVSALAARRSAAHLAGVRSAGTHLARKAGCG
jgi:hypothetical protein